MSPTLERRLGWALPVIACLLGLIRLGAGDVIDPSEARTIGVAQDVLRGHVLWPTFNDGVIPPDPPAHAWLVAGVIRVLGFSEGFTRLPGVFAWAALVAAVVRVGRSLGAPVAGLAAGLFLVATPGLAAAARTANPSVTFAAAETVALSFAWEWLRTDRREAATCSLVAATVAALFGGPSAIVLLFGVLASTLGQQGTFPRIARFPTAAGVATACLALGAWYGGGIVQVGEPFLARHLGGAALAHLARAFDWQEPWSDRSLFFHLTFHAIALVRMTLPWTPLVLVALLGLRDPRARRDPRMQFLLAWAFLPIALFLATREKAWTDVVVALPPLALLAAHAADGLSRRWPRPLIVTRRAMVPAAGVTLLALAAVTLFVYHPGVLPRADRNWLESLIAATGNGGATLLGVAGTIGGLIAGLVAARAWPLLAPSLAAIGLAWNAIAVPAATWAASDIATLRPFAVRVARIIEPTDEIVFYGRTQRPVVVYLDRIVPSLRLRADSLPTGAFVVLRSRAYEELRQAGRLSPPLVQGGGRMHDGRPGHLVLARVLAAPPPPSLLDAEPS